MFLFFSLQADMVDHQQLMRVYGALMWSLGKVLGTPEVSRVYIGSFWDQPLRYDMNRKLFEAEEQDLFADLQSLPRNAALRKLNDLIKRARLAKVGILPFHCYKYMNYSPLFRTKPQYNFNFTKRGIHLPYRCMHISFLRCAKTCHRCSGKTAKRRS